MGLIFTKTSSNSVKLSKINIKEFYFLIACVMSISLIQTSYAQTQLDSDQITFSDNLLNDPIAQDILQKIEQTKKMIVELEQKEYEKNQAQENLQKMRDISVQHLKQDLDEWERLSEKYSARNAFDEFVSKKPSYVQGVFWDQFEFKEKKINAGRIAMNQVLINGGTMKDARNAYHKAASTQKIELIEMNAQFNVKHNLAYYEEQQIFNSTGKVHMSPTTQVKLANFYSDYRLQPSYIVTNSDVNTSENNSATECAKGLVLVSRVTSASHSCIDENVAKKWISDEVKGIVISGDTSPISNIKTNPGTVCKDGYQVIYSIVASEYKCVLESDAKEMIENNTAENHTLIDYILNKDKLKVHKDEVYQINQEILGINQEYDLKKKALEAKYDEALESEDLQAKQKMQDIINEYKIENITKEDVTKQISEIRKAMDVIQEKILKEKLDAINMFETELKGRILEVVKGYENDLDINVDWDHLNETPGVTSVVNENNMAKSIETSLLDKDKIRLNKIGVVNSFGQKFDEIKPNQILQIAADITNSNDYKNNFVYIVEVTNKEDVTVQPAKWMTGTLNPNQTLNIGLSWVPEEAGEFNGIVSLGTDVDSIFQVADIKINVNPEADVSDEGYCKKGYELLFKYSDNAPICATPNTASKLINIGLAFD
ncbi:MAG: hypothetical protein OEM28_00955 [Nitrosopumilus sp.]|nr:hypothetical protein [Nitrosopumilus sp.]MDH3486434.1 hypothetical protein [Nitrosopumilus sp.]